MPDNLATPRTRPVALVGLPYHFGARPRATGYQMALGPSVLLADAAVPAGLIAHGIDVTREWIVKDEPDEDDYGNDMRLLPPGDQLIRQLAQNRRLARSVKDAIADGRLPVTAAGNCISSLGAVGGIDDDSIGMIWFDAHADANTPETSTNGMMDGMPVAIIAGLCWQRYRENIPGFHVIPEDRIITAGNHEIYSANARPRKHGGSALGRVVDPPVIAEAGFVAAMTAAVDDLATRVTRVYVHLDVDVIDNAYVWGNRHASDGGLSPDDLRDAFGIIAQRLEIAAINITAFDPTADERAAEVLVPLITDVVRRAAGA